MLAYLIYSNSDDNCRTCTFHTVMMIMKKNQVEVLVFIDLLAGPADRFIVNNRKLVHGEKVLGDTM